MLLTMRELDRLGDQTHTQLHQLFDVQLDEIDKAAEHATYLGYRIQLMIFAALLIGAVGAVGLSITLAAWLSHPILAITHGSRRMAGGETSRSGWRLTLGVSGSRPEHLPRDHRGAWGSAHDGESRGRWKRRAIHNDLATLPT